MCDKGFDIAKNPKYDGYQMGLGSVVWGAELADMYSISKLVKKFVF